MSQHCCTNISTYSSRWILYGKQVVRRMTVRTTERRGDRVSRTSTGTSHQHCNGVHWTHPAPVPNSQALKDNSDHFPLFKLKKRTFCHINGSAPLRKPLAFTRRAQISTTADGSLGIPEVHQPSARTRARSRTFPVFRRFWTAEDKQEDPGTQRFYPRFLHSEHSSVLTCWLLPTIYRLFLPVLSTPLPTSGSGFITDFYSYAPFPWSCIYWHFHWVGEEAQSLSQPSFSVQAIRDVTAWKILLRSVALGWNRLCRRRETADEGWNQHSSERGAKNTECKQIPRAAVGEASN